MIRQPLLFAVVLVTAIASTAIATTASAQTDRVYDKSGKNVSGTVAQTSSKGIQVKRGGNNENILAGDIEKILYEGDPSELTQAREFAIDGQYEQALDELKKIDPKTIKREVIEADFAYYTAYSQGKMALAGRGPKDVAAKNVLAFIGKYRESWHLFDAAKLLGDLAMALGNATEAIKYYKFLEKAASPDTQIESVYLQGLVAVKSNDPAPAIELFDKIIGLNAQSPQTLRLQAMAKAGKAVALAQSGKAAEGLGLVDDLIAKLNPGDIEMSARIYNAQGASYEASGDAEGAVLAYLHTHLMFSSVPDAHAEALLRLIELWPKVGKPERAAEARQELQQRYPGAS